MLFAVIGMLLVTAFWQRQNVQPAAEQRRDDLISRIDRATQGAGEAQQKTAQLRARVSQLQQLATGGLGEQFSEPVRSLEVATGFVALTGPGAVVTLDDAEAPLPSGVEPA